MQPLKAPKDSQFICAWTRGSLPYAAAEHCRNADFSIILTRSQELERIAAEVELWLATNN
jgi:benzoyl-CoA reductase/2-hydroxyglutaryl-CoA dehydratase subunit BcrC/BadD/HgdB